VVITCIKNLAFGNGKENNAKGDDNGDGHKP